MTTTRRSLLGGAAAVLSAPVARAQGSSRTKPSVSACSRICPEPHRDMAGPNSGGMRAPALRGVYRRQGYERRGASGRSSDSADVGATIARRWFDEQGVDVVVDVLNSAVALAVSSIAREKNKVALICAATTELTGRQCSPNTVHWSHDTWMLAKPTATSILKSGGDLWFLIAPNYTFRPPACAGRGALHS